LRELTQPLAAMVAKGEVAEEAIVRVEAAVEGDRLSIEVV